MQTTQDEQTAWEVWDEEDTRLYRRMFNVEQDMHESDAEVRGLEEKIAELEEELVAARVRRSRFALQRDQAKQKLAPATKKYNAHHDLEPEQD